ncbi:MAG TPA: hypothetical protein VIJ01_05105 [Candidatus Angelobacter sp.]|jgi:hypothetical protein
MRRAISLLVVCVATLLSAQSNSSKYQSALILEVKEHQGPIPDHILEKIKDPSAAHYDISIRLKGNHAEYVLLYTPPPGRYGFQFTKGMDRLVLVESDTITFNDIAGRSITAPILSQRPAQP